MPFIITPADQRTEVVSESVHIDWILEPGHLADDRLTVARVTLAPGTSWTLTTDPSELAWVQPLSGTLHDQQGDLSPDWVVMAARGAECEFTAHTASELFVCRAPHAADYDPELATGIRRVDWSTEPVLQSEHDTRQRIYLASAGLWGTEAVRGEMIMYPPGASGAPHHHEGAEHFQYILSGSGIANLADEEVTLNPGDFLYNYENELHSFANNTDSTMTFVEFFVPGESRTVWAPGANVCTWNPTATDVKGRPPARQLAAHVHGEGNV